MGMLEHLEGSCHHTLQRCEQNIHFSENLVGVVLLATTSSPGVFI